MQVDPAVMVGVELLHLLSGGVGEGRRHQDRHLFGMVDTTPPHGSHQHQSHQHQQQATQRWHQPMATGTFNPDNCSSAQSRTV